MISCSDDYIPITLNPCAGGSQYTWSNGSNLASIQVNQSGTYIFEGTYPRGIALNSIKIFKDPCDCNFICRRRSHQILAI